MNASELLRIKLANNLFCTSQQISVGPTGPTGSQGPAGTAAGIMKGFTIYLDYSATNVISKVYIPPGLFSVASGLSAGGVFTTDQGSNLVFYGTSGQDFITMQGTTYDFVCGILGSGYVADQKWSSMPYGNIMGTRTSYEVTTLNSVRINGLGLVNINGANLAVRPGVSDPLYGYLVTITLLYV